MERFWSKVDKHGPYPHKKACRIWPEIEGKRCWIWTACVVDGYGQMTGGIKAHRYSYELKYGKGSLGKKKCLHKCDVPNCVRWLHLFKGTDRDNSNDKVLKRRHTYGKSHCEAIRETNAKLTVVEVKRIRRLHQTGKFSYKELSLRFRVCMYTIGAIIKRKTWRYT
jgi:hypothetical protein